ncbi:Protein of unknown function [Leuconostoc citreum LBAE E16]|nr:Protein of unknown function [Leuconostoc citreum LBAE E16]
MLDKKNYEYSKKNA